MDDVVEAVMEDSVASTSSDAIVVEIDADVDDSGKKTVVDFSKKGPLIRKVFLFIFFIYRFNARCKLDNWAVQYVEKFWKL